jgi:hypothetical protein
LKGPRLADLAGARPKPSGVNRKRAKPERKSLPHFSVYISEAVNREIRRLAVELDLKPHDLYIEAINLMFKEHGRKSIAEIDGKA